MIEFFENGLHKEGGADYTVVQDGVYRGLLCFTSDWTGRWRGRLVMDGADLVIYTESLDDAKDWARQCVMDRAA